MAFLPQLHPAESSSARMNEKHGGFLKSGYLEIIHFDRIVHEKKQTSYWGTYMEKPNIPPGTPIAGLSKEV